MNGKMILSVISVAVGFLLVAERGNCASIVLTTPLLGNSPYFIMLKLGEELHSRGHKVTMVRGENVRYRKSSFKQVIYSGEIPEKFKDMSSMIKDSLAAGGMQLRKTLSMLVTVFTAGCNSMISDNTVMDKFKEADVIVGVSLYFCGDLIAAYVQKPYITVHPAAFTGLASLSMVPLPPSYVPAIQSGMTDKMNFVERLKNLALFTAKELMMRLLLYPMFKPFQQKYNIHPDKSLGEVMGMAEIHIVQSDFAIEFAHPLMPNTFYVGPILPQPPSPLPTDLEKVMKNAGNAGVILVSFGSEINALTDAMLETMAAAFAKLKQTVIWKIKVPDGMKLSQNVKVQSWIPQNDILGHPKMKAFVSHMGANGALEAAYHGVPIVAAPLMSDGYENALRLCERGKMGKFIDIYKADVDTWVKTIEEVVNDPKYKENGTRVSSLIRSFPRTSSQRAADLIDYVLDNGGRVPHLRAYAYNLTWWQYHNLDVMSFLFSIISLIVFIMYKVLRCCCGFICSKKGSKKKKE